MKVKVYPSTIFSNATIALPPSKSIAHRAIICSSLANGVSKLSPIEYSEDIVATINAMKKLGAHIIEKPSSLIIFGISNQLINQTYEIDCNESASTLRFCIPLFALLNQNSIFIGKPTLLKRPLDVYTSLFQKNGLMFVQHSEYISIHGPLTGGHYVIDKNISSQFITGLFLALPLCEKNSIVELKDNIESYPYILMTIYLLKLYGIKIEVVTKNKFLIQANQHYKAHDLTIEGDYSQFAYLALIGILNQPLTITNLPSSSIQGDKIILKYLQQLNVQMEEFSNKITIYPSNISSMKFDLANHPDLAIALCALAMFKKESILLENISRLEFKESNRIQSMIEEFLKLGVDIVFDNQTLIIHGSDIEHFCKNELSSHHDHRILMALFICCFNCQNPIVINDCECINKSFPSFYRLMKEIGVHFEFIK